MSRYERNHNVVTIRTNKQTHHKSQDELGVILPVEHEMPVIREIHHHREGHPSTNGRFKSSNDDNITIVETHKYFESDSDLTSRQRRTRHSSSHEEQENQLVQDNRRLREELEEHLRLLEKMRHDTESLSQKLDHLTKDRERIDKDHDAEIQELKKRVRDLEAIRSDLESKLQHHDNEKEDHNQKLQHKIDKLKQELDRRTQQIEQMTFEHQQEISNMISVDREKSLLRQIDEYANISSRDTLHIQEKHAEIEAMKNSHIPMQREEELVEKIRKLKAALNEKEAEVNRLHHEVQEKETLRMELDRLRHECEFKRNEHATSLNKYLLLEEDSRNAQSLKGLVHEQENLIAELRQENDSLKMALANFKRDCKCNDLAATTKNTHMVDQFSIGTQCPKCLEESSRLLTQQYKATLPPMQHVPVKLDSNIEGQLSASKLRIKQLEQWLDEVLYTDGNYHVSQKVPAVHPKVCFDRVGPSFESLNYRIKPENRRNPRAKKPASNLTGNLTGLITDRHANCSENCIHHNSRHHPGRIA